MKKDNKIVSLENFKSEKEREKELKQQKRKEQLEKMDAKDISYEDFIENMDNILEELNNNEMSYEVLEIEKYNTLKDYLEEYRKVTLMYLCSTLKLIVDINFSPEIDFTFRKKEVYIEEILDIIANNLNKILQILRKSELELLKDISKYGILGIEPEVNKEVEKGIQVLTRLGLVFVQYKNINGAAEDLLEIMKQDQEELIIANMHVPTDIRYKILENIKKSYSRRNESILNLINSCINIYGAIYITELYDILKLLIQDLTKKEVEEIIAFRTIIESELFIINEENTMIFRLDLANKNEEAKKIAKIRKEKYTLGFYLENIDSTYVHKFPEYKQGLELIESTEIISQIENKEEYEMMIQTYINLSQINPKEAKKIIKKAIRIFPAISNKEVKELLAILDEIVVKYPKWNQGGKINY